MNNYIYTPLDGPLPISIEYKDLYFKIYRNKPEDREIQVLITGLEGVYVHSRTYQPSSICPLTHAKTFVEDALNDLEKKG